MAGEQSNMSAEAEAVSHMPIKQRIKQIIPERVKKPIRPLIWLMRNVGQIPRDTVGGFRNGNAVFLWIPKTAGATLYSVLDRHICTKLLHLTEARIRFRNKGLVTFGHMDYAQLVENGVVGAGFDNTAFKFCFSRNPYSRAVSLYCFSRKRQWIDQKISFLDFCQMIERGVDDIGLFNVQGLSLSNPQTRWLRGVVPDFVGRVENFDEDLRRVFEALRLSVPEKIRAKNRTSHSPYRDYYCVESARIVSKVYADDFERFDYAPQL